MNLGVRSQKETYIMELLMVYQRTTNQMNGWNLLENEHRVRREGGRSIL